MQSETQIDYIAEAIEETFGERCPDYSDGCPTCEAWKRFDYLESLAALSTDAEPVAWMDDGDTRNGSTSNSFRVVTAETKAAMPRASADNFNTPLYAAPPAPFVAVKALEWHKQAMSHGYGLFIRLARTSFGDYQISHGTAGKYEVYFNKGPISAAYDSAPEAKAVAQADYEARIRSALSAQVQDADEQRTETCQRCQGNGEIVTDWERYRHLHENDVGDEAVAECPDCDGIGKVSAQVQDVAGDEEWQTVPKHPTGKMIDAVVSMVDGDAPHPFILNLYRAMLAVAPAKQEGGE